MFATDGTTTGSPILEVEQVLSEFTQRMKNVPLGKVVQTASDLPFSAPSDAKGAYWRGSIYLVADNIASAQDAREVIAHEVIGHFGLRGFFGRELDAVLNRIHESNPRVQIQADKSKQDNQTLIATNPMNLTLSPRTAIDASDVVALIAKINGGLDVPRIFSFATFNDFPQKVQDASNDAGLAPSDFRGVTLGNKAYVVHGNHSSLADVQSTIIRTQSDVKFMPGAAPIESSILDGVISRITAKWKGNGQASVVRIATFDTLPAPILQAAKKQGYDNHSTNERIPGVTWQGKVYLVQENITSAALAEQTLLHERVHQVLSGNTNDIGSINQGLRQAQLQSGDSAIRFSRIQANLPDVSDPRTGISTALLELGQDANLFQYPRSDALYLEHIAEDKSVIGDDGKPRTIEVLPVDRSTDDAAQWMLANTTPKDDDATDTRSWMLKTPTGKWATLTKTKGTVYINVSGVGEGNGGSAIYDLAANFALNNGLVFVGDPSGVSPAAMRRRLENMLSSAIKYGTTDHLQPHPDQYLGDASIGVPELDWKKGDTLGNIRSMIDVSIGANAHTNPFATALIHYDP